MTQDDNKRLIEKLKKLFALGASPNQHEAEAALAKANQLMQEHQIEMSAIDLSDQGDVIRDVWQLQEPRPWSKWMSYLAEACANLYDGKTARIESYTGVVLVFYGFGQDIMAAKMTFTHLLETWKGLVKIDSAAYKAAGNSLLGYQNSHAFGYVSAIRKRVNALAEERRGNVTAATGRDLVPLKDAAVEDAMKGIGKAAATRTQANNSALAAGRKRGNDVPLTAAMRQDKVLQIAAK